MLSHALPIVGTPAGFAFDGPSEWLRFSDQGREFVYVADGSQIYSIDGPEFDSAALEGDPIALLGIPQPKAIRSNPPKSAPIRALSLAVAQKCNLACTYCYAEGGEFGGAPQAMTEATAREAVDCLFKSTRPGDRVNLSFLGGEPLLARQVLQRTTEYAAKISTRLGVPIGFAVTTNATLLNEEDAEFFERYGFAVTVSIDGIGADHDRQRPFRSGRGSFDRVIANVRPLFGRSIHVFARATVISAKSDLRTTLDELLSLGFRSVGFSPLLAAPNGRFELREEHLLDLLAQMINCGQEFERQVAAGNDYGFANMVDAMGEIHRGAHRAYPCGAGNGYFGVSADGNLYACHRFVGDSAAAMGNVVEGVHSSLQEDWLASRHVTHQEPCNSCWARFLCGGGCHHEVLRRGRPACEYIRGWLRYALGAYVRLLSARPEYFAANSHDESL